MWLSASPARGGCPRPAAPPSASRPGAPRPAPRGRSSRAGRAGKARRPAEPGAAPACLGAAAPGGAPRSTLPLSWTPVTLGTQVTEGGTPCGCRRGAPRTRPPASRPPAPTSAAARVLPGARPALRGRVLESSPGRPCAGRGEMQPGSPPAPRPLLRGAPLGAAAAAGARGVREISCGLPSHWSRRSLPRASAVLPAHPAPWKRLRMGLRSWRWLRGVYSRASRLLGPYAPGLRAPRAAGARWLPWLRALLKRVPRRGESWLLSFPVAGRSPAGRPRRPQYFRGPGERVARSPAGA